MPGAVQADVAAVQSDLLFLFRTDCCRLLGKLFAKRYEQYKWLPESLKAFPDLNQLADIFREIGLRNVRPIR